MGLDAALAGAATSVLNALGRDMWVKRRVGSFDPATLKAEDGETTVKVRGAVLGSASARSGDGVIRKAAKSGRPFSKVPGIKIIIDTSGSFAPVPGFHLRTEPGGKWYRIFHVDPVVGQSGPLVYTLQAEG